MLKPYRIALNLIQSASSAPSTECQILKRILDLFSDDRDTKRKAVSGLLNGTFEFYAH